MFGLRMNWKRTMLIAVLGLVLVAASDPLPDGDDFGAAFRLTSPVSLVSVLADPDAFKENPVLIRARISDVCQRKGCWTILREGEQTVRVRFKDYGFFLPKNISGREALVEGVVTIRTLSEREARHYEEEAKDGQPKSIQGPQDEVGFLATGVRVLPASAES